MALIIRQVCKGDVWDFSAGTVEGMILKSRVGGNSCGFVTQFDDTAENRAILNQGLDRPVADFLFYAIMGSIISFWFWAILGLIFYPIFIKIKKKS